MHSFVFDRKYIQSVKQFFGSDMPDTLAEYLEEGDHARVAEVLRNSHEWKTVSDATDAILNGNYVEVTATALREQQLKDLEDRCTLALCAHCGHLYSEHELEPATV